ncbi:MAG: hypothetical protein KKG59_04955 [Nanoarchaeota archaeon]|nr:hypothetical protein [Nanoarchaeota archaeon]
MAKPIRATPTLKGIDAVNFIKDVLKEEKNPSKARIALIKEAAAIRFNY